MSLIETRSFTLTSAAALIIPIRARGAAFLALQYRSAGPGQLMTWYAADPAGANGLQIMMTVSGDPAEMYSLGFPAPWDTVAITANSADVTSGYYQLFGSPRAAYGRVLCQMWNGTCNLSSDHDIWVPDRNVLITSVDLLVSANKAHHVWDAPKVQTTNIGTETLFTVAGATGGITRYKDHPIVGRPYIGIHNDDAGANATVSACVWGRLS